MGVQIHPQAIVDPKAELGTDVVVSILPLIGPNAKLVIVQKLCIMPRWKERYRWAQNRVFPYATIGGLTHDLKYQVGDPGLEIGDDNIFREYVTAHVATEENDFTRIGSHNVFLAYSHVAHDCQVKNHLVMSSHAALGGTCGGGRLCEYRLGCRSSSVLQVGTPCNGFCLF